MSDHRVVKNVNWQARLLLLIMLAGFALRLYQLGGDSLWYDETVSAFLSTESVPELIAHTARDIHPPAYYLLLHFWTALAGQSEFVLAFFSLTFGVLLIPLTFLLAKRLADNSTALWAALLVAVSPYHLWYSQEVRMYTLGAALAIITAYCVWQFIDPSSNPRKMGRFWIGYVLAATLGLYTLYYFAFFLIALNHFFIIESAIILHRWRGRLITGHVNFPLFSANILILIAYLPWLPTAWRQITNPPVPPWRTFELTGLWPALLESWSTLALGQSVEPQSVWPVLILFLLLFYLGFRHLNQVPAWPTGPSWLDQLVSPVNLLLLSYLLGPLCLILVISTIQPLYHVRYLFTYSAPFYIIIAAGLTWLNQRWRLWPALLAVGIVLASSAFSIERYHVDPRFRADDYRSAVQFIRQQWQPGDVILVNAGYVYPAFVYYNTLPNLARRRLVPYEIPTEANQPLLLQTGSVDGSAQLGWSDPQADFYTMSTAETTAALEGMSHDFARLWLLRVYDTVTDPAGLMRNWLVNHATPLEDQPFAGESNMRVQGWLLPGAPPPPPGQPSVEFADGMTLVAHNLPNQSWQAGQTIYVHLWWATQHKPTVDYKISLKLWDTNANLAAQGRDDWPVGVLYRATVWPTGQAVYQPAQITLPPTLTAGQYWLNVELYHPETGQPLARLDGADPVVTLGSVTIE